jgi:hypothetical protein
MKTIRYLFAIIGCGACACGLAASSLAAPAIEAKSGNTGAVDDHSAASVKSESAAPAKEQAEPDYSYQEARWTHSTGAGRLGNLRAPKPGDLRSKAAPPEHNRAGLPSASHNPVKVAEPHHAALVKPAASKGLMVSAVAAHRTQPAFAAHSTPFTGMRLEPARFRSSGAATLGGLSHSKITYTAALNGTEIKPRP